MHSWKGRSERKDLCEKTVDMRKAYPLQYSNPFGMPARWMEMERPVSPDTRMQMSSVISGELTGPKFTKFLHNVVRSCAAVNDV